MLRNIKTILRKCARRGGRIHKPGAACHFRAHAMPATAIKVRLIASSRLGSIGGLLWELERPGYLPDPTLLVS